MKRLLTIAILIYITAFCFNVYTQDQGTELFNKGVSLYTEGQYDEARECWMEIYNNGHRSAELCFNIANACFKLNDVPGSILFYERALQLDPSSEDINYNLQIARTLTVDRFEEIPELFFIKWYNLMALSLSTDTWAYLSILSFLLFLILISAYLYSGKYRVKVMAFWLSLALFILSLASFALSHRNKGLVYDNRVAIITSPQVSGKSSPDNSGNDLFVLHEGTKVKIEEKVGEWYNIRLSDGNKGWIPTASLEII